MSKDSNTGQRAIRQRPTTKIIVERHYVSTKIMETVFKRIAEKQIIKKVVLAGCEKTDHEIQEEVIIFCRQKSANIFWHMRNQLMMFYNSWQK